MVEDGLFELFPVEAVYGMHNSAGIALGQFAVQNGPAMAAADMFELTLTGKGSHGAHPHHGVDPLVTGAESLMNLITNAAILPPSTRRMRRPTR